MGQFRSACVLSATQIRRWGKDIRIWFLLIFAALFTVKYTKPVMQYGVDAGKTCTVYVLPLLFCKIEIYMGVAKVLLHVIMVLLLCDAPFFNPATPYAILRSRRNGWWLGQCFYIIMAGFLYLLFVMAVSMIVMLPIANWKDQWGDAVKDFIFGNGTQTAIELYAKYKVVVPKEIVCYLYPSGTQLYTFLTVWASFIFLGLVMYLVSLVASNVLWGMGIAAFFIFLDPFLQFMTQYRYKWLLVFSPISWNSIDTLSLLDVEQKVVSLPFVGGMYIVLIAGLMGCIWWCSRKISIRTI